MAVGLMRSGVCHYSTERPLKVVQCFHKENWTSLTSEPDETTAKTVIYTLTFLAIASLFTYNFLLISHINSESVSTVMHETYLVKKECEFCLGISSNWLTRYFFLFTSYRSGI